MQFMSNPTFLKKSNGFLICLLAAAVLGLNCWVEKPDWGFFAHREINRLAIATLPADLQVFFKKNADWIAEHATDADIRRYASPVEAPRHFIDLDGFNSQPPARRFDAMFSMTQIFVVENHAGDTLLVADSVIGLPQFFARHVLPRFFENEKSLPADSLAEFLGMSHGSLQAAFFKEKFTERGILPWHLQKMQSDLTDAFRQKNARKIMRLAADIGHYLADAHVPLHTCSNYNGQKTGQHGIHAFWESRLPELFATEQFDFWVGKPDYLPDPTDFFWKTILESHRLVDSVLSTEKLLRQTYPADQQFCLETHGNQLLTLPCRDFAKVWQQMLAGMVERRMRESVKAVAAAWFTAWVDAGQPDLSNLETPQPTTAERAEEKMWLEKMRLGKILGRHESH